LTIGPRWLHFGLTTALNVAAYCVAGKNVPPGQRAYGLATGTVKLSTDQKAEVRVPPSAPRSTALRPFGSGLLANGFANTALLTGRNRAREEVCGLSDLIADYVCLDP